MVSMNDVTHQIKIGDRMSDSTMSSDDASCTMWIRHTFLQPYRLLHQLSSFPTLFAVYKVLVTIAITSASAERAMNKVKLVKTRLRSRMTDEYFSSLMVIATEKDLADKLSSDKIINRLASISPVLRKYLLWS
jgi:hAT family C-terminal dimerisation region